MVPVPKAPGVTSTTKAAATPTTKAPLITATCADVDAKYGSNLPPGYTLAQAETLLAQSCTPADLQSIVVAKGSTTAVAAVAVTYTESLICPANPGTKLCP
jgi:hypothetical protein